MNNQSNEIETTQRAWVTPRLMRLNQAEGTDKHVLNFAETVHPAYGPTCDGGSVLQGNYSQSGTGPAGCGPS